MSTETAGDTLASMSAVLDNAVNLDGRRPLNFISPRPSYASILRTDGFSNNCTWNSAQDKQISKPTSKASYPSLKCSKDEAKVGIAVINFEVETCNDLGRKPPLKLTDNLDNQCKMSGRLTRKGKNVKFSIDLDTEVKSQNDSGDRQIEECNSKFIAFQSENKENIDCQETRRFLVDHDGWLTKIPNAKKAKVEKQGFSSEVIDNRKTDQFKPLQKQYQQNYSRGGSRGMNLGKNSSLRNQNNRNDNLYRRQNTNYSSRLNIDNKNQQTRGYGQNNYSTVSKKGNDPTLNASGSEHFDTVNLEFVPTSPPIIRRPELTPPPPPACGTFSYRDVVKKNLLTPPKEILKISMNEAKKYPAIGAQASMKGSKYADVTSGIQRSVNHNEKTQQIEIANEVIESTIANVSNEIHPPSPEISNLKCFSHPNPIYEQGLACGEIDISNSKGYCEVEEIEVKATLDKFTKQVDNAQIISPKLTNRDTPSPTIKKSEKKSSKSDERQHSFNLKCNITNDGMSEVSPKMEKNRDLSDNANKKGRSRLQKVGNRKKSVADDNSNSNILSYSAALKTSCDGLPLAKVLVEESCNLLNKEAIDDAFDEHCMVERETCISDENLLTKDKSNDLIIDTEPPVIEETCEELNLVEENVPDSTDLNPDEYISSNDSILMESDDQVSDIKSSKHFVSVITTDLSCDTSEISPVNLINDDMVTIHPILDVDHLVAPPSTPCEPDIDENLDEESRCQRLDTKEKSLELITCAARELETKSLEISEMLSKYDSQSSNICSLVSVVADPINFLPKDDVLNNHDKYTTNECKLDEHENCQIKPIVLESEEKNETKPETDVKLENEGNNTDQYSNTALSSANSQNYNIDLDVDNSNCDYASPSQPSMQHISKKRIACETNFPNVSQTWSTEPESRESISEVLPQRTPKWKQTNPPVYYETISNDISLKNNENNKDKVCDIVSEETNYSNFILVQDTCLADKVKPEWNDVTNSTVSTDIYGDLKDDHTSSATTIISNSLSNLTSSSNPSGNSDPSEIWSSDSSCKQSTILNKAGINPLSDLLKISDSSVVNIPSVNYYKDASPTRSNSVTAISNVGNCHAVPVNTGLDSKSLASQSEISSTIPTFNKMPDVVTNQSNFIKNFPTNVQTIPITSREINSINQSSNYISSGAHHISGMSPGIQNSNINPYINHNSFNSQSNILHTQDLEYSQIPTQHTNIVQQQMNFLQQPSTIQYPNMFDPRWNRNYPVDVSQAELAGFNRFSGNERDYNRPQLHALSQPFGMFNFPPPPIQSSQKDQVFPNFNYPPPPFQQGYRLQSLPGFLQRPPPPIPPQFNNGAWNRNFSPLSQRPQRVSPDPRNFSSPYHKSEGDKMRFSSSPYHDLAKSNQNANYRSGMGPGETRFHAAKLNRSSPLHQPQDPTLADFLPRNMETYKSEKLNSQDSTMGQNWKKLGNYQDKRNFNVNRKIYKPDLNEDHPYSLQPPDSSFAEHDKQLAGGSRRKSSFKSSVSHSTDTQNISNKGLVEQKLGAAQVNFDKVKVDYLQGHEKAAVQMQYNGSDYYGTSQSYSTMMPPVELNSNPIACGYADSKECANSASSLEYNYVNNNVRDKVDFEDSQFCNQFDMSQQEFCGGGWKYYHETMTSPSGLRIHQSTYVPYPNPCGSMPTTYLSTNDVRARIQWLGFKKAHEIYSSRINAQKSLRMDVTVVCSKGSAVCCNSDILGTCSTYFYERLVGRTEEYLTIFVNVPSKIMKHFLQMMSCGEAFVPINDVNEVIVKSPIYLNLGMCIN